MNLKKLNSLFIENGCTKIYIKKLSPNDNSKNQVYLGGSFEILNILPISEIKTEEAGNWHKERFKASINFSWISEEGNLYPAPNSQLILYPKYPEVRFSGFLTKCEKPPSELMTQRLADRLFFFGVSKQGTVLGFVTAPDSELSREFLNIPSVYESGLFQVIELKHTENSKTVLLNELLRIHQLGWINSKRLDGQGNILPCIATQCGGYTLEAELGVRPNGHSLPDFLGWEIKNLGVQNFKNLNSHVVTLMTPEPTGGFYKTEGKELFLRKYGYADKSGKADRINFGGTHKVGIVHPSTKLEIQLIGFDVESGKIRNTNGRISLVDLDGNETASWNFASMLLHWNRKHNQACYVPSVTEKGDIKRYKYGSSIILGEGTDFHLFLQQMAIGNVYYDPGTRMKEASAVKPDIKPRNQFRVKSQHLPSLYKQNEVVNLLIL